MGYIFSMVIAILVIPIFIGGYFYTEATLDKFGGELTKIEVPENTRILDTRTEFGTIFGNGDHCDYFSGVIFDTENSKEDTENYFKSQYKGESQLEFVWLDEDKKYPEDYDFYLQYGPIRDLIIDNPSALLRGIVYIYKPDAAFDFRCLI